MKLKSDHTIMPDKTLIFAGLSGIHIHGYHLWNRGAVPDVVLRPAWVTRHSAKYAFEGIIALKRALESRSES